MNNFGMQNIGMFNLGMNNVGMNNMGMNNAGINNMGMNNVGMNDNGLNNIGFNNMGINPINMDNQPNLMDENALRIKNIILPYENKIKELEEIIRQKDFEIAILKDKLNNNNNIQNQNLTNINQMNMMIQFQSKEINNKGKEIVVLLKLDSVSQILQKKFICYENDMAYKLLDQINENLHWNLLKYYCNGKKIHPFLTIKENGIEDGSIIISSFAYNIVFKHVNGFMMNIAEDENYPIKKAIKYYLLRIGKEGCFKEFTFFWNAKKLNIEDKTPIKILFGGLKNITIIVQ